MSFSPLCFSTIGWRRILECTISLRFLGIILRVLRLEVPQSAYNVYITNQFKTTFAQGGKGCKICLYRWLWIARRKLLRFLFQLRYRSRPLAAVGPSRHAWYYFSRFLINRLRCSSKFRAAIFLVTTVSEVIAPLGRNGWEWNRAVAVVVWYIYCRSAAGRFVEVTPLIVYHVERLHW